MMKEIERRCEVAEDSGVACGPAGITAVCAEMQIECEGEKKYLTCSWCDEAAESFSFEVTAESIFDYLTMKNDDLDELQKIRETESELYLSDDGEYCGDYVEQYHILVQMVKDKIVLENLYEFDEDDGN